MEIKLHVESKCQPELSQNEQWFYLIGRCGPILPYGDGFGAGSNNWHLSTENRAWGEGSNGSETRFGSGLFYKDYD